MICKGCNQERKLVKAHIIPESFFRDLRAEEKTLKLISNTKGVHTKRAPVGVYDKEILCKECEDLFQEVDDYAAKILINDESHEELKEHGKVVGYRIKDVNYEMLKRFVISILWRASISNHFFYSKVNLGPLEKKAKKLIWSKSSGDTHEFSFVLARFDNTGTASKSMLDPHKERWSGRRYYRFYIGGYVLYVKADSQTTPKEWVDFIPSDNNLIIVSRGNIENSKEYPILVNGVKVNKKT